MNTTKATSSSRSTLRFVAPLLALLLGLGACVGGGGSSEPTYDTVRDVGIEVVAALCDQAIDCGDLADSDFNVCLDTLVDIFCDDRVCGAIPASSDAVINDCVFAIEVQECGIDSLPAECQDIL